MYSTNIAGVPVLCQVSMAVSLNTEARKNSYAHKSFHNTIAGVNRCYEESKEGKGIGE